MSSRAVLRRSELLGHLSDEQLTALDGCLSRSRYPAGVTVVRQGDTTREAYLIESGEVAVEVETPYGKFTLATLGPGQLFGETTMVDHEPRSGDAVTRRDSVLLVFNPVALSTLMQRDNRFAVGLLWMLWKSLAHKLRATNEKLARFFSEAGSPATSKAETASKQPTGSFRLALADKRALFAEQKLSSLEINFLSALSREKKLAPGQVLFREGDPGDAMYVVLSGRVMISKLIPGAGEEALAFLERGDYFGEMALIENQPRSADAKAGESGAVVLQLPGEVVTGLLDMQKVSSLRLLEILIGLVAKRLREVDEKIVGWFILAGGGGGAQELTAELRLGLAELDIEGGGLVGRDLDASDE